MRTPWLLIVLFCLVGGGLGWLLLGGPGSGREAGVPGGPAAEEEELAPEDRHLRHRTTTLVVRVTAPDGSVPEGAEVGYARRGRTRWLYAGEDGRRAFADAPLGAVMVVARATGYEEARTPRELLAGVPTEVHLIVHPAAD